MDAQEQLYSLLAIADEHQKAIAETLKGLATERSALHTAAQGIQKAAGDAVMAAVSASLAAVSKNATAALESSTKPILGQLSGVVKAASAAESKLSGAVAAFGWRWAALASITAAGAIAAIVVSAYLMVWYQQSQIDQLSTQKTQLISDVAQLQAQADDLARRGGRVKLESCGAAKRLCVRIDKTNGYGKDGDYFVLHGY